MWEEQLYLYDLSKDVGERFKEEHNTTIFKSHRDAMKDYVLIQDAMLEDLEPLAAYLNEAYDHAISLKPK